MSTITKSLNEFRKEVGKMDDLEKVQSIKQMLGIMMEIVAAKEKIREAEDFLYDAEKNSHMGLFYRLNSISEEDMDGRIFQAVTEFLNSREMWLKSLLPPEEKDECDGKCG